MTVHTFVADLAATGTQSAIPDAPVKDGAFYVDAESDAGEFQFTVDTQAGVEVDEGRTVTFKIDGTPDRMGIIEKPKVTPVAVDRTKRVAVVTGRDIIAEFDYIKVAPPLGWATQPVPTTVWFNYLHPFMDRSTWNTPTFLGPVFHADLDPFGGPWYTPWDAKPGRHPEGWTDAFSGWYWPSAPDGSHSHPIDQRAYWYHELALEEVAPVILIHTSDDIGTLGFDGALVDAGTNPPGVQWVNATAAGIEQITGLTHYVTGRSTNTATYYDNPGNTWNPGAFACVAYQQLSSIYLNYDNIIMRTSGDPSSGDPLQGGGWLCTSRDFGDPEPGFTPGRAFRLLFEQAQAAGFLVGWTLDFDDDWDSNDEAWEETSLLSARVGSDSLLDVIRNWHGLGVWDAWSDPADRVLHACAWGKRGNYAHTSVGTGVDWHENEVIETTMTGMA